MTDYLIMYGNCECYVWPIAVGQPLGRCGRCRTQPEGPYAPDREAALAKFRSDHGRDPEPIGART